MYSGIVFWPRVEDENADSLKHVCDRCKRWAATTRTSVLFVVDKSQFTEAEFLTIQLEVRFFTLSSRPFFHRLIRYAC